MRIRPFSLSQSFSLLICWMLIWMFLGWTSVMVAQPHSLTPPEQYISKWSDEAVYQMAVHGIPASITLAQGILESGSGRSELAAQSNNHFGIKCHSNWPGERVYFDDDEKGECFRSYNSASESFQDHSDFLKRKRYASLFELDIEDYKGWAKGLKQCGYATNPKYAYLLIDLIEEYDLTRYDQEGLTLKAEREAFAQLEADAVPAIPPVASVEVQNTVLNPAKTALLIGKRSVQLSENYIQYTLAQEKDTYESLAKELDMMLWQLYRYNDVERTQHEYTPMQGEVIYLQPKRKKGTDLWLELKPGESIWAASQRCGVQMNSLISKNRLTQENPLPRNGKLSLRWKITKAGKLPDWVRMIHGPNA
ncbi:MAG: glycoside hydrolase family 73 protein [Flavobacteriales bacterium]